MSLTASQLAAVNSDAPQILVIAGAGSGKTRVATERIARILGEGLAGPSELLVLTFTNKAAREMRSRLVDRLGDERRVPDLMGTFHAVCLKLLRAHGYLLGYDTGRLTVIDTADADLLLRSVAEDLGCKLSFKKLGQIREAVYTGNPVRDWEDSDILAGGRVFEEYLGRLRQFNVLDFGSILTETNRLFEQHPDLLAQYHARIKHVLVDELQDSDETNYRLHTWLTPPANFFGVGDTRQSIYAFRGARPDLMRKQYPTAELVDLTACFRCGPHIVAAANALIAVNGDTMAKPMVSASGGDDEVQTFHGRSEDIAKRVREQHDLGCGSAWSDFAVLARTHRVLKRLQQVFDEAGIPCQRIGGGWDITGTDEFRTLLAAMRLCCNPGDNLAFLRLAPHFGCGPVEYAEIRRDAAFIGTGHFHALTSQTRRFAGIHLADAIRSNGPGTTLLVSYFIERMMVHITPPAAVLDFWRENCRDATVQEALDWFATYDLDRENETEPRDAVTLCTAHAAKGLEWPYVFVVELNEGNFPSSQSVRAGDVSEERRLCYVAATRAQRGLYLHFREAADQAVDRPIQPISRFIAEAGAR